MKILKLRVFFLLRNQFIRNLVLGPLKIKKILELQKILLSVDKRPLSLFREHSNFYMICISNLAFEHYVSFLNFYISLKLETI